MFIAIPMLVVIFLKFFFFLVMFNYFVAKEGNHWVKSQSKEPPK